MKIRKGYMLRNIAGISYILPVGQNIADHKRGIRLNESGMLLFHALQKECTEEELISLLLSHYDAKDFKLPLIKEDVHQFLTQLASLGILRKTPEMHTSSNISKLYLRIGTLTILYQSPADLIHPSFYDFVCEPDTPDMTICIVPSPPRTHDNGEILIRTRDIIICENETDYLFLYPTDSEVLEGFTSKDGSYVEFHCVNRPCTSLRDKLFHAVRFAFLIKAQLSGLFALHSASLLYQGKAWLFSGSSGTGKSTHTAIWNRLFETPLLNGDLNLIGIRDGTPVVYGIPWCGTSGIYTTMTHPLGGITLLGRAETDKELPLTADEKSLKVMQRFISPSWTESMVDKNLDFAVGLQTKIPIVSFQCTKKDSAAYTMKAIIDRISGEI